MLSDPVQTSAASGSDAVILRKVSGKPFFQKDHVRMLCILSPSSVS